MHVHPWCCVATPAHSLALSWASCRQNVRARATCECCQPFMCGAVRLHLHRFAFCELLADMKAPALFPRAIAVCTSMMAPLYIVVGAVGYWSRGMKVTDIVIFSLGDSLQARMAAGLILLQVTGWHTAAFGPFREQPSGLAALWCARSVRTT